MLKKIIFLVLMAICIGHEAKSQTCESFGYPLFKQPKELNRGRLKFPTMLYGKPYTTFDRKTDCLLMKL